MKCDQSPKDTVEIPACRVTFIGSSTLNETGDWLNVRKIRSSLLELTRSASPGFGWRIQSVGTAPCAMAYRVEVGPRASIQLEKLNATVLSAVERKIIVVSTKCRCHGSSAARWYARRSFRAVQATGSATGAFRIAELVAPANHANRREQEIISARSHEARHRTSPSEGGLWECSFP